ncbi:2Fe-2S iron-sulfur cluster-binding protein [Pseudomonas tussilaginis]|uniref:2Fe-2S iron-sulfur cluster-binding protein n=1 Tax=Pseudomonas putida TaxID=303 RepID=UPI002363D97E|nr:2Fe-2S iron-sulfur cluster-binding protein [Pseudomonas putida]MDD1976278.1 (2Fe-2S)-binding protein [Pseudomonas putida]
MIIYLQHQALEIPAGISVAAALAYAGNSASRHSCSGQLRAPFCGMGICQECRMTIDGQRQLACQTLCREGMQVECCS